MNDMSEMRRLINIVESALFEYKTDITVQQQGDKLKQAADKVEQNKNLTPVQIVQGLEKMDPTNKKNYMMWIIKQYVSGKMRLEDGQRIKTALADYHSAKPQLPQEQRDIGKFDLHSLEELVDSFAQDTGVQAKTQEKFQHLDDMEIMYDGPLGLLAVPKTPEASCELGKGTKWCTASRSNNMFDEYNDDGPLFVFIERPGNDKYQFHFEARQFMDARDRPLDSEKLNYFRTQQPITKKLFAKRESVMLRDIAKDPYLVTEYALEIVGGRWKDAEPVIAKNPASAFQYAYKVLDGRWPEAEPVIAKDPESALKYARYVIKGRWPEAESVIAKDPEQASQYADFVIKGRWPEAESVIAKNPQGAAQYARYVIKGKWPEAEPAIATNPKSALEYAKWVLRDRWPEAESVIAKDPESAYYYALGVIKDRWPEAESVIAKDPEYAKFYAKNIVRGEFP